MSNSKELSQLAAAVTVESGVVSIDNKLSIVEGTDASHVLTKSQVEALIQTKDQLSELSGSSDDVTEGSNNLYYTDERVQTKLENVSGHIIPDTNITYDLGSETYRFRDLYLSGNSIYMDGITLTNDNGTFSIIDNDSNVVAVSLDANSTDDLTEGDNLYYTTTRFDDRLALKTTDDLTEGDNLYYTDTRARASVSVTDNGGDGSISYDNETGVISYTGPSSTEVRAHFSAGTGVDISNGVVSIGQAVATTSNVTFNDIDATGDVVIDGNLTVSGTTTTIEATNLAVSDNMIYLNEGSIEANPDIGIAGNYNDGTYAHTGLFRDATDGRWKFFDGYTPEPDASVYIDIGHASFSLADVQGGTFYGEFSGNASTASKWETARTLSFTGDVTGTNSVDGSTNVATALTLANSGVTAGTYGSSTLIPSITVDGKGRITAASTNSITVGDGAMTVTAGSGLTGGGQLGTANQSGASSITISHADTSSVANLSSDNSGNTFIQDISLTFDTYGHVTGASVATGTVSVGDGAMTVTAGSGLTGGGQLGTANQSGASSVTISHADTSSQASVDNSNGTVIQDITLDTYGHITAIGSVDLDGRYFTETESDSRFYRKYETTAISDYNDLTSGAYSTTSTTATNIPYSNYNGTWNISDPTNDRQYQIYMGDTSAGGLRFRSKQGATTGWHGWEKVWTDVNDGSGSGLDADLLDGQHGSYYYSAGNPPPYPAEADTLATVTARGASTSTAVTLSSTSNHYSGHFYFDAYDAAGNHYPHFLDGPSNGGVDINWRLYTGTTNSHTHIWNTTTTQFVTKLESTVRVDAPIFYDRDDTAYYANPNGTSVFNALNLYNNAPLAFLSNGNSGTYNGTQIYTNQNNTSASASNGIFIERGRLTDSASAEIRYLTIGSRGGQIQWQLDGSGNTTQTGGVYAAGVVSGTGGRLVLRDDSLENHATASDTAGVAISYYGYASSPLYYRDFSVYDGKGGLRFRSYGSANYSYASGSMRSPIFYDSDDTGYYVDPNSTSNIGAVRISSSWGNGFGGLPEQFQIRGTYPSFTQRSSTSNSVWLHHMDSSGEIQHYYAGNGLDSQDWSTRHTMYNDGTFSSISSHRAPIFYDLDNTAYYLDPASTGTSLQVAGTIEQGNNYAHPNIEWSVAGSSTGEVIFYLPGTTSNYGMVHMVFDIYEYDSPRMCTVIVGGHNWSTSWYNIACNVVGYTDKAVRLGVKDGRFVVVFGGTGTTWSYGQVRLRKIQNGSYYNNSMDLGGNWATTQTTSESFTYITGDLRNLRTPSNLEVDGISYAYTSSRSPIFYDYNDTGYYVDSNNISRLYGLSIVGDANSTDSRNQIFFWGSDTTTSAIGFKSNGGEFGNPTGNGDGYNTYLTMDTDGRGWVFRRGTGGSDFTSAYNSGWILNNGLWQANSSMRAPIFYDSDDTAYYFDGTGGSRQSKFFTISGNTSGNYGNELVVGNTSVSYSLEDGNQRPIIQAHGAYPVLSLNHTVTSNTSHGPTVQYTANGTGYQFVHGINGTGNKFYMGYSNNTNWNPHNGIAGYSGTTFLETTTDGYTGIGAPGNWGGLGNGDPSYHLHFKGYNNAPTGYAAVFQNMANGVTGGGFLFQNDYGNHSYGMVAEFRTNGAGDRPAISFSSSNTTTEWSIGYCAADDNFRISQDHGYRNSSWGTARLLVDTGGNVYNYVSTRSPIYYDSDDTGYYCDPNSTSNLNGLTLGGRNMRLFEHNSYIEFSVGGDANTYYPVRFDVSAWMHWGRWSISRGYADTAPWDPIGTGVHHGGLTLTWEWSGDGAWGGNDHYVRIIEFTEQYTTMVAGLQLSVNGMIVWLRGGNAYYRFHGPGGMSNSATPYYTTYTASNGSTYAPREYSSNSVASDINARYPVRGSGSLYEGNHWVLHEDEWQNGKLFDSGGIIYANASMRAPIFYDYNDTGYYIDPNADLAIRVYGEICNSNFAQGNLQPGSLNIGRTDTNYHWTGNWSSSVTTGILANCADNWEMAIHDSAERVVSPFAFWGGGNHYLEMGRDIGWGSMPIYAANSFRAPIFYDSDDTAYYTNPASTSVMNRIDLNPAGTARIQWRPAGSGTIGVGITALNSSYGSINIEVADNDTGGIIIDNEGVTTYGAGDTGWIFRAIDEDVWQGNGNNIDAAMTFGVGQGADAGIRVRGSGYATNDWRAPIFYDSSDTSYYIDPNSTSNSALRMRGGALFGPNPTWGTYLYVGTDGNVDVNTATVATTNGNLHLDAANGYVMYLNNYATSSFTVISQSARSPIFYDSNDTNYYLDPASSGLALKVNGNIEVVARSASWAEGIRIRAPSRSTWAGLRFTRDEGNYNGNWAIGYTGIDSTDDLTFWGNSSGSESMKARMDLSANFTVYGSMRSPIFYDSNDTGYYADPASTSHFGNIDVASRTLSSAYYDAAIEVREYNYGGSQTDSDAYQPRIGFHWGGRVASSIAMNSSGWLMIRNNPGTGYEDFIAASIYATGNVTAYYSDERLKTKVGVIDNAINKVQSIETFLYVNNELAKEKGFTDDDVQVGLSAQSIEKVLPEVVKHAPFDMVSVDGKIESASGEWYKTVQYERVVPLLIEAIKEQQSQIDELKTTINILVDKLNKFIN